jgi:hypothetical protein
MLRPTPPPRTGRSSGSALVLTLAAFLVVVFMGALVIDGGLVYGKRAEIAKAVDAAAIAGISNLSHGQNAASQLAHDMFEANYRMTNRDAQPPDLDITFGFDPNGNETVNLRGTAHLRPVFLTIFPRFDVFHVHADSQATRAQLRLALSLDRSGSMGPNGGCSSLPAAVDTFVEFFDNDRDFFSLNTFSSATRLDVRIRNQFKGPVHAAVPRQCDEYTGFTFFTGGLDLAFQQNQSLPMDTETTVLKVIVIFTDGMSNTVQDDRVVCPPIHTFNISGGDALPTQFSNDIYLLDPVTGLRVDSSQNGGTFESCPYFTYFDSDRRNGMQVHVTGPNAGNEIRAEASFRSLAKATEARIAGNIIYTIGLGGGADQDFLREIANDPTSPRFDPSQPAGEFTYVPDASQLQSVFEIVARKILVRLSI